MTILVREMAQQTKAEIIFMVELEVDRGPMRLKVWSRGIRFRSITR
jgi:hypothetical protein